MRKARYICFEGTEGVGKTTQTTKLIEHLRSKGHKVLDTKEPGSYHLPLTMLLRSVMLDAQYEDQMTVNSREFISQAIRSIHLEKLIKPALNKYDFIVQDRGIISGIAYGEACGVDSHFLSLLADEVYRCSGIKNESLSYDILYNDVIYLTGNVSKSLYRASSSKQEFESGDAIENRGTAFIDKASSNMEKCISGFVNVHRIDVDGKGIEEVFNQILQKLELQ
jgi:dTMP kinase